MKSEGPQFIRKNSQSTKSKIQEGWLLLGNEELKVFFLEQSSVAVINWRLQHAFIFFLMDFSRGFHFLWNREPCYLLWRPVQVVQRVMKWNWAKEILGWKSGGKIYLQQVPLFCEIISQGKWTSNGPITRVTLNENEKQPVLETERENDLIFHL